MVLSERGGSGIAHSRSALRWGDAKAVGGSTYYGHTKSYSALDRQCLNHRTVYSLISEGCING